MGTSQQSKRPYVARALHPALSALDEQPIVIGGGPINSRFYVDIDMFWNGKMVIEWSPDAPKPGEMTDADLAMYRTIRDRVIAEFAALREINVGVLDVAFS